MPVTHHGGRSVDNVLVTGGAGFVGSALAIGVKSKHPKTRVLALDNLKRRGSELNLPRLRDAGVDFVHGDIRNPEDLEGIGSVDLMLECSAEPSVLAGYGDSPGYAIDTNLGGTIHCLEFARTRNVAMIFLSTSRVYPMKTLNQLNFVEDATRFSLAAEQTVAGASEKGISEDFPLAGPRSLYGATKFASELILQEYREAYGLKGLVNRCGVIAGPWQMGKVDQGVAALWAARHVYGGSLSYIGYGGAGKQVRDLLHIDDLLDLILYQMDHFEELDGETFNVGGGPKNSVSLCELTDICREISGNTIEIGSEAEDRPGDIRLYITDNSHVTERAGWRPKKDIPTIVQDIVAWLESNEAQLRPILGP
ncbi:MAG: NAD-dependent epimerase/dehydratase family protein [Candidatus Hydrogenedentes bacterium]|nr:NAD-dependent epimerase/dehydratase family protein [Candidatus Hydrogenedentota bacterium]